MEVNSKSILSLIAKKLELEASTIEKRLQLQKAMYLLQAAGLKLGYGFSWYKYGPYSQELADDAHTVLTAEKEEYKTGTEGWGFGEKTGGIMKKFIDWYTPFKGDLGLLELAASVMFMKRVWGFGYGDIDEFYKELKERKKALLNDGNYEKKDVKNAIKLLESAPFNA